MELIDAALFSHHVSLLLEVVCGVAFNSTQFKTKMEVSCSLLVADQIKSCKPLSIHAGTE